MKTIYKAILGIFDILFEMKLVMMSSRMGDYNSSRRETTPGVLKIH